MPAPPRLRARAGDAQALKALIASGGAVALEPVAVAAAAAAAAAIAADPFGARGVALELEGSDAPALTEPNAIARYLLATSPKHSLPELTAATDDWLEHEAAVLRPAALRLAACEHAAAEARAPLNPLGAAAREAAPEEVALRAAELKAALAQRLEPALAQSPRGPLAAGAGAAGASSPAPLSLADACLYCTLLPLARLGALERVSPLAAAYVSAVEESLLEIGGEGARALALGDDAALLSAAALSGRAALAKSPRLPRPGARNILITSALPYVNNVPHLGNIIGCVLSADVYARYCRSRGHNAVFVCGTDEYGTATETKALEENLSCARLCDKYHAVHRSVYEWFGIEFDRFGRTPTGAQTRICQDIFRTLWSKGLCVEQAMEQLYSEAAGKFLADRFVSGTCPRCAYADARGDQCDGCGALMNPTELLEPKCKLTGTTPVVRTTRHIFLDLPRLAPALQQYQDEASALGGWSQNCVTLTAAWMRDGLKARCITRDLRWGIPVPLEGYRDKVFYVWFDAPIGYVSITAAYAGAEGWRGWWAPPAAAGGGGGNASASSSSSAPPDVELVQFMGKDNVPFHTVIFPATLLGASASTTGERAAGAAAADAASSGGAGADGGNANASSSNNDDNAEWTLMRSISVTEYLNYEGGKFSKSRGTGVFGTDARDTGIPVEVWRYYLLSVRPESSDTDFRWGDLAARANGELLKNLGNFVNRALVFVAKFFEGVVPEAHATKGVEDARELGVLARAKVDEYCSLLEKQKLREGLRVAMALSADGNAFFTRTEPFRVVKVDREHAGTLVAAGVGLLRVLAALVQPYMPTMAEQILKQLALPASAGRLTDALVSGCAEPHLLIPAGHRIGETAPLVREIREEEVAALKERFGGDQRADAEAAAAAAAAGGGAAAAGGKKGGGGKQGAAAEATGDDDPTRPVDFSRLDVRVGIVKKAWRHPGADSLYVEEVDVGDGGGGVGGGNGAAAADAAAPTTRQVVSGLAHHVPLESLVGRRVVVLCNLKPAAVRGQMSHAMVLCATQAAPPPPPADGAAEGAAEGGRPPPPPQPPRERLELLEPPEGAAVGERVVVAGFERAPETQLNPRKKVFEAVAKELATDTQGVATYRGLPLTTARGPVKAATIAGGGVR